MLERLLNIHLVTTNATVSTWICSGPRHPRRAPGAPGQLARACLATHNATALTCLCLGRLHQRRAREVPERLPHIRLAMPIGPCTRVTLEKYLNDFHMSTLRRQMQLSQLLVLGVHIGAVLEKLLNSFSVSISRCQMQRSHVVVEARSLKRSHPVGIRPPGMLPSREIYRKQHNASNFL
jgi:hypothetical protein